VALVLPPSVLDAQTPAPAPATDAGPHSFAHQLEHLKQLTNLIERTTPTKDARAALYRQVQARIRAALAPVVSDRSLPADTRNAARNAAGSKEFSILTNRLSAGSLPSSPWTRAQDAIRDLVFQTQQVVLAGYPAFSVVAPAGSSSGLTEVPACGGIAGRYGSLESRLAANAATLRRLADSVGRVEVQIGRGTPEPRGTAFVIDWQLGLVATACHVVDDIAELPPGRGAWVIPASRFTQNGQPAKILLDFGETDAHDPRREYEVTAVAFVPNIQGCDGALLRVDTGKPLPPELTAATAEPQIPSPLQLDVYSIGYPSRDLSAASPDTKQYFNCVRSQTGATAKFLFGGDVLSDESKGAYHVMAHVVPTHQGQSGSPIFDATDLSNPRVIGIHVCCVESAKSQTGSPCQWRNELALQEAVSLVDLMKLYRAAQPGQ
jgi:hypothetical protein